MQKHKYNKLNEININIIIHTSNAYCRKREKDKRLTAWVLPSAKEEGSCRSPVMAELTEDGDGSPEDGSGSPEYRRWGSGY